MNNGFYGKTCEDVRKYNDVRIITSYEEMKKTHKVVIFEKMANTYIVKTLQV